MLDKRATDHPPLSDDQYNPYSELEASIGNTSSISHQISMKEYQTRIKQANSSQSSMGSNVSRNKGCHIDAYTQDNYIEAMMMLHRKGGGGKVD